MERIKTLIISGKLTIEHNYRDTNERIRTLLESTGRFQVQITEEFRGATSETVSGYDLIIFDYDGKDMPTDSYQRIGEAAERTLFDFIKAGGGFMIHHSSTILDPGLPEEYYKIWGYYVPSECCRRAPVDDWFADIHPGDPITDGLSPKLMCPMDDIFGGVRKCPGTDPEVLVTVFDDVKNYDVPWWPPAHHPVHIPDGDLNKLPGVNTDIPLEVAGGQELMDGKAE